jgi:hypothetical protein
MTIAQFTKATKTLAKLRLAIFGPSGAGKTFTALRLAKGIGGKVALIDTERGSASKYSDRFDFDTAILDDKTLMSYIDAIQAAAKAGYDILIIDSLTHGWRELIDEVEKLARTKFGGNSWAAWSEGTPKQRKFIDALLNYPGHVIATMRSKTEWTVSKDQNGKSTPVRLGLAPEEGKGIEYEFDLLMEMTVEHYATIIKDRTGRYQDKVLDRPGEEFGAEVAAWLQEGAPLPRDNQLLESLIKLGVLNPTATTKHVRTLLALSPFGLDMELSKKDEFESWAVVFRAGHDGGLSNEQAAAAATVAMQ